MRKNKLIIVLLLAVSLGITLSGCRKFFPVDKEVTDTKTVSDTRDIFAMDTVMTVTAYGERAAEAVQAAADEIDRLDQLFSVGNAESDISRLNTEKEAVVSQETVELIRRSKELYTSTGGALNIAVYPLMETWGFTTGEYQVPMENEVTALLAHMDVGDIKIDIDTVALAPQMGIDLGAIAKGYTSARLMDIFSSYNIASAIVSLGGNVQTLGTKPDGTKWRVAIEDPFSKDGEAYAGILSIEDMAVITSGAYERYFEQDGKRYHHILDPSTGYPAENGLASVTIVSKDGALADALSTALFVMGKDKAIAYWKEHADTFEVILIEDTGEMTISQGLEEMFASEKAYAVVNR